MELINPTRTELLAKHAQIALAELGRDLLKDKRSALWKELMRTADQVLRRSDELDQAATTARHALARAEALDGREAVQSAAFAAKRNVSIDVKSVSLMGVHVPEIERKRLARAATQRSYSLASTTARIDMAAACFEDELEWVIELAAGEMRLRRLAEEVRKTTVRVNALDMVLLPMLQAQRKIIERVLSEREREDIFRLKRVKSAIQSKREHAKHLAATGNY